ncbi:hypothetical protein LMH87_001960 [Akanthomyces muscarius]|uniref:Uncharacterized protein n=1 Tax=Akanthomyces muscarius TaxID=2231603 RepID=A0A9W8UJ74_AKAMU|nr:hypothetical protein LMH87_001960 [Akanthomyces muscarius]KAJ4147443.1 hypothetical protein LMH87_001960 [Akanthomyces muscarius]
MQTMDRHSKLAEIKLVSKYYPVANYSYPSPMSPTSPTISRQDRTSVGSDGSTPGLIDDRTDSEVSQEDDYQRHTQTTELWDSFWRPGGEWRLEDAQLDLTLNVSEEHPALVPSQHKRQPSQESVAGDSPSWPLPNPVASTRKPAATYSAFPSIRPLPRTSPVPAPLSPRSPVTSTFAGGCLPPPRPHRSDALLTPCLEQPLQVPAALTSPVLPPRTDSRPKTSSGAAHRPKKSIDGFFRDNANIFGIHSAASRSSEDLTKVPSTTEPPHRAPRHYKSTTYLGAARQQQRQHLVQQQQQQPQQAEPQSVFEEDSDCEEPAGISFFRFHKRSGSDKSCKSSAATQEAALTRKRRNRADTIPVPSTTKPPSSERERKVDVFGRMLGRRSR